MNTLTYHHNSATAASIHQHLACCDALFMPPLSERLDIESYAAKIKQFAECFECMSSNQMIGLVAMYCNDSERQQAHITTVSVLPSYQGQGIARILMKMATEFAQKHAFQKITLHVHSKNAQAIQLYHKFGFIFSQALNDQDVEMTLTLTTNETRLQ